MSGIKTVKKFFLHSLTFTKILLTQLCDIGIALKFYFLANFFLWSQSCKFLLLCFSASVSLLTPKNFRIHYFFSIFFSWCIFYLIEISFNAVGPWLLSAFFQPWFFVFDIICRLYLHVFIASASGTVANGHIIGICQTWYRSLVLEACQPFLKKKATKASFKEFFYLNSFRFVWLWKQK